VRTCKPCPFCKHPYSHIEQYDLDFFRVCNYCGASTRPCSSKAVAGREWNDRRHTVTRDRAAARAAGGEA